MLVEAFCQDELSSPPAKPRTRFSFQLGTDESSRRQNASASTLQACAPRHRLRSLIAFAALFLCWSATIATAQESPAPEPSPPAVVARSVRISFLPPPLEGSISLGIYDTKGKLVRVLYREAELDDFQIGEDALSTTWDGRNDEGQESPPGKYHARGFVVADIEVEGVSFFFNDWVTDDRSPHIKAIENFVRNTEQSLVLLARLAGGETALIPLSLEGRVADDWEEAGSGGVDFADLISPNRRNLRVEGGKLTLAVLDYGKPVSWPELFAPRDADYGRAETVWVVEQAAGETTAEVKQFSSKGEFLRRLNIPPDEPIPRLIRASATDDKIFLLEESPSIQRLRQLTLIETKNEAGKPVSDWKVGFEKKILAHKDFGIEGAKPVITGGKTPPEKVAIKLGPNPLVNDAKASVEVSVGHDESGSFLKTADGLPLQTISETPNLIRVILSPHGEKSIDVFQDDDAVVEQFRISGLDQMMAFDCGAFDLN
ncbi:MAG: hypothetical protein M3Q89_12680 [Verrucomicrobiota bacterium]|nr:hypothetical protein [Verrucomicrobiota bacterium]